jgi:periplasmic protein TonB
MLKNKIQSNIQRFSLRYALILSFLTHIILVTDLGTFNIKLLDEQPELIEFEAIFLTKKAPEPIPEPEPTPEPEPEPEPELELPKEDVVVIKEKRPVIPKEQTQKKEEPNSTKPKVKAVETTDQDIKNAGVEAQDDFSRELAIHIAKFKKYPRIAARRGWQGEVVLEVELTGKGQLIKKGVMKSSGHKPLDTEAMKMIDRAVPFPAPPSILSESTFTILVPISFTLR